MTLHTRLNTSTDIQLIAKVRNIATLTQLATTHTNWTLQIRHPDLGAVTTATPRETL